MASKKKNIELLSSADLIQKQRELYLARVKNSLRSLDNVSSIRKNKKLIAQQKTLLVK